MSVSIQSPVQGESKKMEVIGNLHAPTQYHPKQPNLQPPHSPIIRRVTPSPVPINTSPESTEISPSNTLSPPVHCKYCQAESIHECEEDEIIPVIVKTANYEQSQELLFQVIMSASKPAGGEGGGRLNPEPPPPYRQARPVKKR